jgi:hypothetical protein
VFIGHISAIFRPRPGISAIYRPIQLRSPALSVAPALFDARIRWVLYGCLAMLYRCLASNCQIRFSHGLYGLRVAIAEDDQTNT